MPLRVLTAADTGAHAGWCALIRAVFPRAGFERWIQWGCWDEGYRAFAWYEDDLPVANLSLTRMRLLLDGAEQLAWQLGAVATHPDWRGRGLGRRLMEVVLAECAADPLLLFANPKVLDFYPRFGFQAREEWIFGAEHAVCPAREKAPALDPQSPAARESIRRLSRRSHPCTARFGARGYGGIALWYLANGFAAPPLQPRPGLLVFCAQEGDCLRIDAVLGEGDIDLGALLPQLIDAPIRSLRFGFAPERLWPAARPLEQDRDAFLHIRGFTPRAPHRFPVLAHT